MTCRGGKEASERRSGIGEDDREPVMVQLATSVEAFQFGGIGNT